MLSSDWSPTSDAINQLPVKLKRYIHDLETRCDPAGEVFERWKLKQENDMLREKIVKLKENTMFNQGKTERELKSELSEALTAKVQADAEERLEMAKWETIYVPITGGKQIPVYYRHATQGDPSSLEFRHPLPDEVLGEYDEMLVLSKMLIKKGTETTSLAKTFLNLVHNYGSNCREAGRAGAKGFGTDEKEALTEASNIKADIESLLGV